MKFKFNWGVGIAITYIVFAGSMILFAVKASEQKLELVSENYYEEAVKYQDKIDATNNAGNRDSKIIIEYIDNPSAIKLTAMGKSHSLTGKLTFYKPDNSDSDFKLSFSTDQSGILVLPVSPLSHGTWKVKAEWMCEGSACYNENKIFVQ